MLAPIARLLHISLDTLLSYHEDLSEVEIRNIVGEVNKRLKELGFEEVFLWVKEKILCKDCTAAEEKLLLK